MYMFGYASSKTDARENFTGFFEYDKETDLQQAKNYMSWTADNKNVIDWVSKMTPEVQASIQYKTSDPSKAVPLNDKHKSLIIQKPILHWYEKKLEGKASFELK